MLPRTLILLTCVAIATTAAAAPLSPAAEIVTAEKVGIETTTYVRNSYKYYAAYKLVLEAQATAATLRGQVAPAKK